MRWTKVFLSILLIILMSCNNTKTEDVWHLKNTIPIAGNSWIINDVDRSSVVLSEDGVFNWQDSQDTIRTFIYTEEAMKIPIGIIAKVSSGSSQIRISLNNQNKQIKIENKKWDTIFIGYLDSKLKGYQYIDMKGISKSDSTFAQIKSFVFEVPSDSTSVKFIKDDFYFGRRGPSTHLVFETPTNDIEWMYSEIEIDKGQDVEGCYFVANGFGEGYFGIQVNSPIERRVLFSIWSPYKTDDPNSIPEDQKIKLLNRGEGVTTGEFGNEGSGGQSYKVFNWKSETRYKFLTRVKPFDANNTDYTAYFFDPDTNQWHLIASFRRPKTNTYLTRPYSFLENFIPNTGALVRRGGFYNQWMRDSNGQWYEIIDAKFSADATARKDARLDYSGGILNDGFYLKNCGFTNDNTPIGTLFKRTKLGIEPTIDFFDLE